MTSSNGSNGNNGNSPFGVSNPTPASVGQQPNQGSTIAQPNAAGVYTYTPNVAAERHQGDGSRVWDFKDGSPSVHVPANATIVRADGSVMQRGSVAVPSVSSSPSAASVVAQPVTSQSTTAPTAGSTVAQPVTNASSASTVASVVEAVATASQRKRRNAKQRGIDDVAVSLFGKDVVSDNLLDAASEARRVNTLQNELKLSASSMFGSQQYHVYDMNSAGDMDYPPAIEHFRALAEANQLEEHMHYSGLLAASDDLPPDVKHEVSAYHAYASMEWKARHSGGVTPPTGPRNIPIGRFAALQMAASSRYRQVTDERSSLLPPNLSTAANYLGKAGDIIKGEDQSLEQTTLDISASGVPLFSQKQLNLINPIEAAAANDAWANTRATYQSMTPEQPARTPPQPLNISAADMSSYLYGGGGGGGGGGGDGGGGSPSGGRGGGQPGNFAQLQAAIVQAIGAGFALNAQMSSAGGGGGGGKSDDAYRYTRASDLNNIFNASDHPLYNLQRELAISQDTAIRDAEAGRANPLLRSLLPAREEGKVALLPGQQAPLVELSDLKKRVSEGYREQLATRRAELKDAKEELIQNKAAMSEHQRQYGDMANLSDDQLEARLGFIEDDATLRTQHEKAESNIIVLEERKRKADEIIATRLEAVHNAELQQRPERFFESYLRNALDEELRPRELSGGERFQRYMIGAMYGAAGQSSVSSDNPSSIAGNRAGKFGMVAGGAALGAYAMNEYLGQGFDGASAAAIMAYGAFTGGKMGVIGMGLQLAMKAVNMAGGVSSSSTFLQAISASETFGAASPSLGAIQQLVGQVAPLELPLTQLDYAVNRMRHTDIFASDTDVAFQTRRYSRMMGITMDKAVEQLNGVAYALGTEVTTLVSPDRLQATHLSSALPHFAELQKRGFNITGLANLQGQSRLYLPGNEDYAVSVANQFHYGYLGVNGRSMMQTEKLTEQAYAMAQGRVMQGLRPRSATYYAERVAAAEAGNELPTTAAYAASENLAMSAGKTLLQPLQGAAEQVLLAYAMDVNKADPFLAAEYAMNMSPSEQAGAFARMGVPAYLRRGMLQAGGLTRRQQSLLGTSEDKERRSAVRRNVANEARLDKPVTAEQQVNDKSLAASQAATEPSRQGQVTAYEDNGDVLARMNQLITETLKFQDQLVRNTISPEQIKKLGDNLLTVNGSLREKLVPALETLSTDLNLLFGKDGQGYLGIDPKTGKPRLHKGKDWMQ